MTLPRFYSRIAAAVGPLVGFDNALENFLKNTAVALYAPDNLESYPSHRAGFLLAINLCARLYPRLHIFAKPDIKDECVSLALRINPACEIDQRVGPVDVSLFWGHSPSSDKSVAVSAENWNVYIDNPEAARMRDANALAALAAGSLGVGEMFRTVFARFLPSGRTIPFPAALNLLTLKEPSPNMPPLPEGVSIGKVHLVGAGAVGQAAVYALSNLRVTGSLAVVDPQVIEVSNLQRYVLSMDEDVGKSKCALVADVLQGSKIDVTTIEHSWGYDYEMTRNAQDVCVAVDSAEARIGIQAALPRRIYNAWTQPADIGWSRHERFGQEPCLACLYIPYGPRPSLHQLIGRAIRQNEIRVLGYLLFKQPVEKPLEIEQLNALRPQPSTSELTQWVSRSILEDLTEQFRIDEATWSGRLISDLYREGICGGAIVTDQTAEVPQEMAVPLAHQSSTAGIMLAAQLIIANCPELAALRDSTPEGRVNVLVPLSQVLGRPRERTPGCLCDDQDFVSRYHEKWGKF